MIVVDDNRTMSVRHPTTIRFLIAALLWLTAAAVAAVEYPDKPPDSDFYVDAAGMLDPAAQQTVNDTASALLNDERIALFVVTIPSLASYNAAALGIEGYAQSLFDAWGIGFEDRNYGILLLVSRGDRKARIEFGADFQHLHDAAAEDVMASLIVPAFKRGDYAIGISDGVRGLDAIARGLGLPQPTAPWWLLPALILAAIGFAFLIYNLFKTGRKGWAWALILALAAILFFVLRTAASGSGGGFGGGSSGGGGATGSW